MRIMNVHAAKTQLSKLLEEVEAGGEVAIARAGRPVARLVPFANVGVRRQLGQDAGLVQIADDFDAPLPDDLLRLFSA
jgi:prevent-host-death family protein